MEKNIAKHIFTDVLWVMHEARGAAEAKVTFELLKNYYQSQNLVWHLECLELAKEQYRHWVRATGATQSGRKEKRGTRSRKNTPPNPHPIRLEKRGRNEWEFVWPSEVLDLMESFNLGCEYLETGETARARRIFNSVAKRCPYFIDAYNHLAVLEWHRGNILKAMSLYQKAFDIGKSVLPENFKGKLPWSWLDNRPFLRSVHGLALTFLRNGEIARAQNLLEWLLKLNPDDHLGARFILEDIKHGTVVWDD